MKPAPPVGLKVAKLTEKFNRKDSPVFNSMLSIQKKKTENTGIAAKEIEDDVTTETEAI